MRALVYRGPHDTVLAEVPDPTPTEDDVVVAVGAVGICGSDVTAYRGQMDTARPGDVRGHEFAGRVVGARGAAESWLGRTVTVNPILSCGSVMATDQAAVFGFPNPLIGIAAFAISSTLGLLVLSRTVLPRWVERGYLLGITLGMVFIGWLITQSLYSIHALCPYCMVVWTVVIPTFWTHLADGLDRGLVPVPRALRGIAR